MVYYVRFTVKDIHVGRSLIYEHLRSIQPPTARVGIACVYCDNQQQRIQTPENILASLWPQLHDSGKDDNLPVMIKNLYTAYTVSGTRPDLDQIKLVLQSTINDLEKAFILIDGLDECSDPEKQETILEPIMAIVAASNSGKRKVGVLITSRLQDDSLDAMSMQIRATEEEIKSMVLRRITMPRSFSKSLRDRVAESSEIQSKIIDTTICKADGMFLFADLLLKSLASAVSVTGLYETLDGMPRSLDEYYEAVWNRISSQEPHLEELAVHTISWMYHAERQLNVEELRHALAVRLDDEAFNADSLVALPAILDACHGLVVAEEHSQATRFMHSSIRDFFQKRLDRLLKDAPAYLAKTCLTYLCLDIFQQEKCDFASSEAVDLYAKPGEIIEEKRILAFRLQQYPFLDYASENWGFHACGDLEKSCEELVIKIIEFTASLYPIENAHMVHPLNRRHVSHDCKDVLPLRVAVSFRLERTACLLIDICAKACQTLEIPHMLLAILEAIEMGLLSVVEALLKFGVDPFPASELPLTILDRTFLYPNERPKTALDKSVHYGHKEITDLLLTRGSLESSTQMTMDYTYAVLAENTSVLDKYLRFFMSEDRGRHDRLNEILHLASRKGKVKCIVFSLENGAFIDSESEEDETGSTALGLAILYGQSHAVEYLLKAGADVLAKYWDQPEDEGCERSLLYGAITSERVFQARLELINEFTLAFSSANINDSGIAAFEKRLKAWLTMEPEPLKLLENLAFMEAIGEDSEHARIIELLLDHGLDVSAREEDGRSLLHLSVISKSRVNAILQYLKRKPQANLNINVRDKYGRTPLHYAAAACNPEAMELLIKEGADVLATDNDGVTALHFAVYSPRCIRLIKQHGGSVNNHHVHLGTPLGFARSIDDPNIHAIEVLESITAETDESGSIEMEMLQGHRNLPDAGSKVFKELVWWISMQKEKYMVLCRSNIEMYLHGSQQQGYMDEMARRMPK